MRHNFLKGNFLPAYGQSFGRVRGESPEPGALTSEKLDARFRQRAANYRNRRFEYVGRIQLGIVVALTVTIGAFNLEWSPKEELSFEASGQEVVQMEEIAQTLQVQKPPPPPPPPIPVAVPDDEILEDAELDLDASLDLDEVITDLPPPPAPVEEFVEDTEPEIFFVVEDMPQMVGGIGELFKDLSYPELARKAGLEGVVVIQITVDDTGTASDPKVIKSVHSVLDDEAIRAVMAQAFIPGKQRGRPVTVALNIPVTFRLN